MSHERGAAVVTAAVVFGLVTWLGLVTMQLIGAVEDRIELETAADAAALAAVGAASVGEDPLDAASVVARLNGADLIRCRCPETRRGAVVATVFVEGELRMPVLGVRTIGATSTAEYDAPQR